MADQDKRLGAEASHGTLDRNEPHQKHAGSDASNVLKLELDLNNVPGADDSSLEQQIDDLEQTLKELNARQVEADQHLQSLHSQTGMLQGKLDTHLDLTDRKLHAVLEKYTGLKADAVRLAESSARLETAMAETRSETAALIKSLDEQTRAHIDEANRGTRELLQIEADLAQQRHQGMFEQLEAAEMRISSVESKAVQLGESLESRVRVLQGTIDAVELRIQQELQRIEEEARKRDEERRQEAIKLREAGAMQARRAQEHEARTGRLESRAAEHEARTGVLESRADSLEQGAEQLAYQAAQLSQDQQALAGRASALEETAAEQEIRIGSLSERLGRHFRGFSGALLLLLLGVFLLGGYFFTQDNALQAQDQIAAEIATSLQAEQTALDAELQAQQGAMQAQQQSLSATDSALHKDILTNQQVIEAQRAEVEALSRKVAALKNSTDSANGRLAAMHPLGNFGADSIIHDEKWFVDQDSTQYLVRLTVTDNQQALYKTADRWAYYLEDRYLAYVRSTQNDAVSYQLYYGPYESKQQADALIRRMPAPNREYPPQLVSVRAIQGLLAR